MGEWGRERRGGEWTGEVGETKGSSLVGLVGKGRLHLRNFEAVVFSIGLLFLFSVLLSSYILHPAGGN